jgi:hypothetical protein
MEKFNDDLPDSLKPSMKFHLDLKAKNLAVPKVNIKI